MTERIVAVDLGASSGRVYAADVSIDGFTLHETARFSNGAVQIGARLYWDLLGLYQGILGGITKANRDRPISSIGVDSWGVDYGLVRKDGSLLSNPASYRDPRTSDSIKLAGTTIGFEELFVRTGVAHQPFNSIFQLMSDESAGYLKEAQHVLLMPDLITYILSGSLGTEFTNASTTQLLGVDGNWDEKLISGAGLDPALLAPLVKPGHIAGIMSHELCERLGVVGDVSIVNVASHDTASAVVAVPAANADFAYISCGTWSLIGMELECPIINDEARERGFTNERGIEDTYRFLHNVMGLWVLQESVRTWERSMGPIDVTQLVARCAAEVSLRSIIDINDPSLLTPGEMPSRITQLCEQGGEPAPQNPEQFTRCILDSLALAYRQAVKDLGRLTGATVQRVHIVGGGTNIALLCQLTADACGVEVFAGPVEAAAIGNILVQARSLGIIGGDRWALRHYLARHTTIDVYSPDSTMTKMFEQSSRRVRI